MRSSLVFLFSVSTLLVTAQENPTGPEISIDDSFDDALDEAFNDLSNDLFDTFPLDLNPDPTLLTSADCSASTNLRTRQRFCKPRTSNNINSQGTPKPPTSPTNSPAPRSSPTAPRYDHPDTSDESSRCKEFLYGELRYAVCDSGKRRDTIRSDAYLEATGHFFELENCRLAPPNSAEVFSCLPNTVYCCAIFFRKNGKGHADVCLQLASLVLGLHKVDRK